MYRQNPEFFVLFFFLLYAQLSAIVSNVYIESGGFILEQFQYGYPTGATVRLVLYNCIFFVFAIMLFEKFQRSPRADEQLPQIGQPGAGARLVYTVTIGVFIFLFAGMVVFGSPLLMGIDRFDYWQNHPFPLLDTVRYKMNILALLLGIVSVQGHRSGKSAKVPMLFLLMICALNILYGDKFSGIVMCSYLYFIPVWLDSVSRTGTLGITRRGIIYCFISGVLLLGIVSYHYRNITVTENVSDLIIARTLGLQGHVWWGIDKDVYRASLGRAASAQPNNAAEVLLGKGDQKTFTGLHSLMYSVSPNSLVNAYVDRGIRFSMGNPAIGLYTLGYRGLLVYQLVTAALFALFACYFQRQIKANNLLRSSICIMLLLALYEAFIMGNIAILFTAYLLKYVALLVAIEGYQGIFGRNSRSCHNGAPAHNPASWGYHGKKSSNNNSQLERSSGYS
jgi:hypothetical protein